MVHIIFLSHLPGSSSPFFSSSIPVVIHIQDHIASNPLLCTSSVHRPWPEYPDQRRSMMHRWYEYRVLLLPMLLLYLLLYCCCLLLLLAEAVPHRYCHPRLFVRIVNRSSSTRTYDHLSILTKKGTLVHPLRVFLRPRVTYNIYVISITGKRRAAGGRHPTAMTYTLYTTLIIIAL